MNKYISQNYRNHTTADAKAKSDVEALMARMGFGNIGLNPSEHHGAVMHHVYNFAGMLKASTRLRRGDILFLQYPLHKYYRWICRVAHLRHARVVVLIHDLRSFRHKSISTELELNRLRHADYIIAGNDVMARELRDRGIKCPIGSLQAWDYLTQTHPIPSRVKEGDVRVAYAGSLTRKNGFLWSWGNVIDGYVVDVYGSGFRMDQVAAPHKFFDHGYVDAEHLIVGMTDDFGLVWDGESIDSCDEYLRLNTPHKVSLYIRAKLPIIIWSGAAMARFVTDHGIGITVDSLAEISARLRSLTPAEIDTMRRNVARLSEQIASGQYFTRAASEAIAALSDNK